MPRFDQMFGVCLALLVGFLLWNAGVSAGQRDWMEATLWLTVLGLCVVILLLLNAIETIRLAVDEDHCEGCPEYPEFYDD